MQGQPTLPPIAYWQCQIDNAQHWGLWNLVVSRFDWTEPATGLVWCLHETPFLEENMENIMMSAALEKGSQVGRGPVIRRAQLLTHTTSVSVHITLVHVGARRRHRAEPFMAAWRRMEEKAESGTRQPRKKLMESFCLSDYELP